MQLVSVNVSLLKTVVHDGKTFETGIFKRPIQGAMHVGTLGLEGDRQGDKLHHGGVHMAVYAYTTANYDFWRRELAQPDLPYGKFGENFTIDGLDEAEVCIGDRFRIGDTLEVEVSVPRAPCSTFATAMNDAEFPKRFLASARVGFYLRVVNEGNVRAGDRVTRSHTDPARLSIAEVIRLMFFDKENKAAIRRAIDVEALSPKWRERFQNMLTSE